MPVAGKKADKEPCPIHTDWHGQHQLDFDPGVSSVNRNYAFFIAVAALVPGFLVPEAVFAQQAVQLPRDPDLSPDGQRMVFAWRGDIWTAATKGGAIRQLTSSPDTESVPKFSPDGKRVAFVSDRNGRSGQVFVMPLRGGQPKQLTFHSDGCSLLQWIDGGESLLVTANRDHYWRDAGRFFRISTKPHSPEKILFDAAGEHGRISPDGDRMLFTREGIAWWRKGYRGSQSSQVWSYDFKNEKFAQLCSDDYGALSPLWAPDGKSFYYVGGNDGTFNLYHKSLDGGDAKKLTGFKDDSVVMPSISADGTTIVFRHLFDLYSFQSDSGNPPTKIPLTCRAEQAIPPVQNVALSEATEVAFSEDGLEIAFVAGGDVWVMDTVLREPKQITKTPEEESSVVFAPDGESLLFASDTEGQSDIWKATRKDATKYWWLNDSFQLDRITTDGDLDSRLRFSPSGEHIAFVKGPGDLWTMKSDGSEQKRYFASWDAPEFEWSPDSKWLTWSVSDNNFNSDVFVAPIDGSQPALNISRHPDNDTGPVWSPDGKVIAFAGQRLGEERDIWFVYLQKSDDEIDERDRKMTEAKEKLEKARKDKAAKSGESPGDKPGDKPEEKKADVPAGADKPAGQDPRSDEPPAESAEVDKDKKEEKKDKEEVPVVKVDPEGIHERIRRVSIPNTGEAGLFWSPDSKKLAFSATIDGKNGTYTVEPATDLVPKLLVAKTGRQARWIKTDNLILWLAGGTPESIEAAGKANSYPFRALSQVDVAAHRGAGFDLAWRAMRDGFYDGNLNNRNWDDIRRKYHDIAANAPDSSSFGDVVNMMLGELNGSHLGFFPGGMGGRGGVAVPAAGGDAWNESTAHFGLRFDAKHAGPGLLVREVILNGPAWRMESRVEVDETVLAIDGTAVDPGMDLTTVLNGPLPRDVVLKVKGTDDAVRDVTIRPISHGAARFLLYDHWVRGNQAKVKQASNDRFGYIHISGMDMPSFYDFERDLFAIAGGKEGLVIDVRENGGGSTADHLLTILTQPVHAITVPRGGGPGYPHDRMVYAPWSQPIVVLCNQNSFSNAEIFSHAIKTLKRGRLVGVPTAGGVISTGGTPIMDLGFLRMPFRGWYLLNDGEDMELNGAVPDFVIWPEPADMMQGVDQQLDKAVSVLDEDVKSWKSRPQPDLKKASERPGRK